MKLAKCLALLSLFVATACVTTTSAPPPAAAPTPPAATFAAMPAATPAPGRFTVPVEYHKLPNGLKVVLSPDHTSPITTIAAYYNIGFRIEPRDRTGFAHLFEHMMFQGSQNLGKMEFIKLVQSNGGILNGSTRFDFTNYFEIAPAHTLQTMLWAEADRMHGLNITQDNLTNQQGVVKSEVRVNVLNRPYGGFPWLDMPQYANTNWYNSHNFYGDLKDIDAATLEDVKNFFNTYYAPNNAVLVVTGDFDPPQAMQWITQYFSDIPAAKVPPQPDITEPTQTEEKRATKQDPKATRPALAVAWHAPKRGTPEYNAMIVLDQILGQGKDSLLYQSLVQKNGYAGEIDATMNALGNPFDINGPTLWTVSLFHDADKKPADIVAAIDAEIAKLQNQPIDKATYDRTMVKMRSAYYDEIEGLFGFGRADLLASFALFDDDPSKINRIESDLMSVTPELIQKTAQEYLRPTNRTILMIEPKSGS